MKFKKVMNYFIWIPFAVAIGAFILYFRYLFEINLFANTPVTAQVNAIMDRYLKIGLFSLFVALLILLVNKISKLFFNNDKYYEENHPWTKENTIEDTKEEPVTIEENDLEVEDVITETEENDDYIIRENIITNDKISEDIKNNKVLKARFIDRNEEKMIEILTDDEEEIEVLSLDNVVVMPEIKRQTVIKVDSSKVKIDGFKKCPKCGNFIVDEAVICVHCGILLDKSLKGKTDGVRRKDKKIFNPVKFAINGIIIILGLIGIILMCNKIEDQKIINESNINSQTNIESIN